MNTPTVSTGECVPLIVTAIEAGPLEYQVCLFAESLRRWGGRAADAHVIAIKPRRGPAISRSTETKLESMNVEYRCIDRDDEFQWFAWINKTAAVREVASKYRGVIVWMDGDILVLDEPSELIFDPHKPDSPQFLACASDKNIGTARDDDEFAPYFRAACLALGIEFQSLPYVLTQTERVPVRAYWNSGVYGLSGDSGLAELHHKFTLTLLAKGIASRESLLFFSDQVSLGLAAHHLGLRRKNLSLSHNFFVSPASVELCLAEAKDKIRLLHYHGCLWPPSFEKLCRGLSYHYPDIAAWLRERGPILNSASPITTRIYRKILGLYRGRKEQAALRHCQLF